MIIYCILDHVVSDSINYLLEMFSLFVHFSLFKL